jgi:hypothetical protein
MASTMDRCSTWRRPTVWIGGVSDKATPRAAWLAEGWYPGALLEAAAPGEPYRLTAEGSDALTLFRSTATASGRDLPTVAVVGSVNVGPRDVEAAVDEIEGSARIGATPT